MKISNIQVIYGPSKWSIVHSNLIILDLKKELSDKLDRESLINPLIELFPPLNTKTEKIPVLVEDLIQELHNRVDAPCTIIKTNGSVKDFNAIYTYQNKEIGILIGQAAVNILNDISKNIIPNTEQIIEEIKNAMKKHELGATSAYILGEAEKRGIPLHRFQNTSLFKLGYGSKQRLIRTAVADSTSGLGIEVAGDKEETKQLLADANVPVPKGLLIEDEEELKKAISAVKYPLVTKPLDGNQGRGVTTHINSLEQAIFGFNIAKKISDTVILEEFIEGEDYRFLVIDYKLVAVARRTPAQVKGDGLSTIQQLIDKINLDPDRGHSSDHVLAPIKVDKSTEKILKEKNLTLTSVLPDKQKLSLKETANISAGGTAEDVTEQVHPFTAFMAERIARLFKLNICGIDIMTTDIEAPLSRQTGAIIEVNAGPGIRMHTNPQAGVARNVAAPIINMLFPTQDAWKIPVIAVSDNANLTHLLAHIAKEAGYQSGYTSSEGIYIQHHRLVEGDFTLSEKAEDLLFDPAVDYAILNCSAKNIIKSGLGFETCDISILTEIRPTDDISENDAITARSILGKRTALEGYAILNADDDLVYSLHSELTCHVALVSSDPENQKVANHIKNKGIAAVLEEDHIAIYNGGKIIIQQLKDIPVIQADSSSSSNINQVLAATLAAYLSKFKWSQIQGALKNYINKYNDLPSFSSGGF